MTLKKVEVERVGTNKRTQCESVNHSQLASITGPATPTSWFETQDIAV